MIKLEIYIEQKAPTGEVSVRVTGPPNHATLKEVEVAEALQDLIKKQLKNVRQTAEN